MAYVGNFPITVPDGGTDSTSFTANAPIVAGTTSISPLVSADTGIGTSGFVFTSTGSGSPPTFQALPASGASLSPYIVGPTLSDFTTIGAAITQAISDGASTTSQINLYIKPGIYTEDPVLSDGINLVGFSPTNDYGTCVGGANVALDTLSVKIVGSLTGPTSGQSKLQNIWLARTSGDSVIVNDGNLFFDACNISTVSGNCFFVNSAGGTAKISLQQCNVIANTASQFYNGTQGTSSSTSFFISSCLVSADSNASVFTANNGINIYAYYSEVRFHFTATGAGTAIEFFANHCEVVSSTTLASGFTSIQQVVGRFSFFNVGSPIITNSAASTQFLAKECDLTPVGPYVTGGAATTYSCCTVNTSNAAGEGLKTISNYAGSDGITLQQGVHTTNATVTTLGSVVVNELETITLKGTITAAQSDHTNALGGDFLITARRATGGNVTLVGSIVTNVNSSSAATFTVDVDTGTQTVRIRCTGIAATVYNWTTTYFYQKVLTNA